MAARSRRTCTFRYSTSAVFAFSAFSTRFTAVRSLDRTARLRTLALRLNLTRFFALLILGNSVLSILWLLAHGQVQPSAESVLRSAESIDETKEPNKNRAAKYCTTSKTVARTPACTLRVPSVDPSVYPSVYPPVGSAA